MVDSKVDCVCSVCGVDYIERSSRVGRMPMCSIACRRSDEALLLRFWSRVEKSDGCWVWIGSMGRGGYGKFTARGVTHLVHRYAYEQLVGPVPTGLQLDHLCRVRNCCNPAHLEPVTPRINTLRGDTLQAANAAKTHCPKGHEYTPENTRVDVRGSRRCRACMAIESRTPVVRARNAMHKRRLREDVAAGEQEAPAWMKKNYKSGFCEICNKRQFDLRRHVNRKHTVRSGA